MVNPFYQSQYYLKSRIGSIGRSLGFRADTVGAWRIWRQELLAAMREALGVVRMVPTDPNPRLTDEVQREGYRRQRVEIDTEPGVTMPLYVLIPDGLAGAAPGLICPHGHGSGGKVCPAGCREVPGVPERIEEYNYDYGVQYARRGYVVFCPDARGFGERRESLYESPEHYFDSSCWQLAHMGIPLGLSVAGMWAWDLMRLLDYMQTRPEVLPDRLGCAGLSGGGLQTLMLSALDERVKCCVVSGYFYGVKDSLLEMPGNCDCNFVPRLWEYADMGDIGALIAPRPAMIEAGTRDPLNGRRGIDNVLEQFEIMRGAYGVLGVPEAAAIDVFEGVHLWHGTMSLEWMDRWLK